ncbi:tetratricopeptide repeat protein [Streptomyces sp. NPDC093225]|uniref:tetratricopeptide repeat protein n=1 Tax=Streptomyces sp. NPDC093225 TaxID=3366034 RepID=UPI00382F6968
MTGRPRRYAPVRALLTLAAGAAVLLATGVRSGPPWAAVVLLALFAGRAPRTPGPPVPARPPVVEAPRAPRTTTGGGAYYEIQIPVRPVPVRGLPADAPFSVGAAVHSQIVHLASPDRTGEPETLRVPVTGCNLLLELTAGDTDVTLQTLTAEVTGSRPLVTDGIALSHRRMPDLAYSADLVESILRSVAAHRPLRTPAYEFRLDSPGPVTARPVTAYVPAFPLTVPAGERRVIVCAPLTDFPHLLLWRLTAEVECAGKVLHPYWPLLLTARTGMAVYSPGGTAAEPVPAHRVSRDHWAPDAPVPEAGQEELRPFVVAAHVSADGQGVVMMPDRPGPAPDPPRAAALNTEGDRLQEAGDLGAAADAYATAAREGSARGAFSLARVLHLAGDRDGAGTWYRQAAGLRATAAFHALGVLALEGGELAAAERWFRQAMDEGDWHAAVGLAVVLHRRGEPAQAESLLRLAVRVDTPDARRHLVALLEQQGRTAEAAEVRAAGVAGAADATE